MRNENEAISLSDRRVGSRASSLIVVSELFNPATSTIRFTLARTEPLHPGFFGVLTHDPDNFEAHANLGSVYLHLDDVEKSKYHSRNAINLQPDHPDPYYNLACVHDRTGEADRAIIFLRQAIARGFKHVEWMKKDPDLPQRLVSH